MGFHGKPVSAAATDSMIARIRELINDSGVSLTPSPPVDDTQPTNISNIKLSSPPDYKLGDKVCHHLVYIFLTDLEFVHA